MRKAYYLAAAAGLLPLVLWGVQTRAADAQAVPSLAPMLESATPAVVNIQVARSAPEARRFRFRLERPGEEEAREFEFDGDIPDRLRRFFEDGSVPFGNGGRRSASGAGSGVVIDAGQGYIVTNQHVVGQASSITVQLSDGRTLDAELVGADSATDIALLKVAADGLVEIEPAEIDEVRVGDYVVAIGNPFGIGQTVTSGIVSALGRTGLNNENYEDFIQTDAAINVGNSGGALVDLNGRLVGINTAIMSGNGGSNGVGFAVPVDMVEAVVGHLERDGEVRRGMLGVNIASVNQDLQAALDIDAEAGAVVTNVVPGSAAEEAGIRPADVIVTFDGREVRDARQLRNAVGLTRRGESVDLVLIREGRRMTVEATIGAAEERRGGRTADRGDLWRGARLRAAAPDSGGGVLVSGVAPGSAAWNAGLREDDVIVEINREPVADIDGFNAAMEGEGRMKALAVRREGREMLLLVP